MARVSPYELGNVAAFVHDAAEGLTGPVVKSRAESVPACAPQQGSGPEGCRNGWVGLGRGAWIAPGPFPQAALRTGRAILTASGSPRGQAVGLMTVTGHGVGIRLPRQR